MKARIYRPAKTAMQSGTGNTREWLLEFDPVQKKFQYPLTGWTSSADMRQELRLYFPTKEAAVAYAKRQGIAFGVEEPKEAKRVIKSYADNFATNQPRF